jgi:hypothetical protein
MLKNEKMTVLCLLSASKRYWRKFFERNLPSAPYVFTGSFPRVWNLHDVSFFAAKVIYLLIITPSNGFAAFLIAGGAGFVQLR